MSLLVDADLALMRAIIAETLPDICNILSESITPDGQGGVTSTWGTVTTNAPCRFDDITARVTELVVAGGGQKAAHRYQLTLLYDETINAGNRVELGGATYTVVGVNASQSWKVDARAVLEVI